MRLVPFCQEIDRLHLRISPVIRLIAPGVKLSELGAFCFPPSDSSPESETATTNPKNDDTSPGFGPDEVPDRRADQTSARLMVILTQTPSLCVKQPTRKWAASRRVFSCFGVGGQLFKNGNMTGEERIMLSQIKPLTQVQRQDAYAAAQQAVMRAVGDRPQRGSG